MSDDGAMVESKKVKKRKLLKLKLKIGRKSKIGLDDGEGTSEDFGGAVDNQSEVKIRFKC